MGEKLETIFQKRLINEVHMDYGSVEKIGEYRENTFNLIKGYFNQNFVNFSKIDNIIIKECTAFDRKTEMRKENYCIELFLDFYDSNFIIEKVDGDYYEINIKESNLNVSFNDDYFNSDKLLKWINDALPKSEINAHQKHVRISEDNIDLIVIPSLFVRNSSGKYYLIPDGDYWKKVDLWYDRNYGDNILDIILFLKHWMRCQGFVNFRLENCFEKSLLEFFDNYEFKDYFYLDFYELLKFIINNQICDNMAFNLVNAENKNFEQTLKESIEIFDKMIILNDEDAIKCFETIFGNSKYDV